MTNAQPVEDIERRLSRLERLMSSDGELLLPTASLAQRNATDFDRMLEVSSSTQVTLGQVMDLTQRNATDFNSILEGISAIQTTLRQVATVTQRNAADIEALTQGIEALTQEMQVMGQRVDSLAAASERHDRILDYLLRREAEDIDPE